MNLNKKVVLITGASRGLGRALSFELGRQGAKIALVARSAKALREILAELRAEGISAEVFPADISDKRAIYPLAAQVAEVLGPIDILIHNASTLGAIPLRLLQDTDCETLSQTLETNVIGPFRLSKAVLGSMILRESGTIIHISSDAAVSLYSTWGAYSMSKAALDHLNRVWAAELTENPAARNIRFLAFDPGEMDTQMHADAMPEADRRTLKNPSAVAQVLRLKLESGSDLSGSRSLL